MATTALPTASRLIPALAKDRALRWVPASATPTTLATIARPSATPKSLVVAMGRAVLKGSVFVTRIAMAAIALSLVKLGQHALVTVRALLQREHASAVSPSTDPTAPSLALPPRLALAMGPVTLTLESAIAPRDTLESRVTPSVTQPPPALGMAIATLKLVLASVQRTMLVPRVPTTVWQRPHAQAMERAPVMALVLAVLTTLALNATLSAPDLEPALDKVLATPPPGAVYVTPTTLATAVSTSVVLPPPAQATGHAPRLELVSAKRTTMERIVPPCARPPPLVVVMAPVVPMVLASVQKTTLVIPARPSAMLQLHALDKALAPVLVPVSAVPIMWAAAVSTSAMLQLLVPGMDSVRAMEHATAVPTIMDQTVPQIVSLLPLVLARVPALQPMGPVNAPLITGVPTVPHSAMQQQLAATMGHAVPRPASACVTPTTTALAAPSSVIQP